MIEIDSIKYRNIKSDKYIKVIETNTNLLPIDIEESLSVSLNSYRKFLVIKVRELLSRNI